ncbi:MAG: AAA domain-containing protein [Gammaproteobacteria bacterium]|nr:AAA domain-containing protein [Gammaproteobacteria bacterium]
MNNRESIVRLRDYMNKRIIGQPDLVESLLVALLADGHLLVEGAPGLAKTRAIKELADAIEGDFHRVQFTPDLLPADLTGTEIYRPENASFEFQKGPIFHNLILADEINRAPAKVQSALLEAMAEHQITVGSQTYPLPQLFLVMATQNPIEQEGTYPLPEAQLDRFLMHVRVTYPDVAAEQAILQLTRKEAHQNDENNDTVDELTQQALFSARDEVLDIHMSCELERYLIEIIMASREPSRYHADLERWIEYGASPRATMSLDRCARANAWLSDRDFVSPDDIQSVAHATLRHRILLSYEAEADGVDTDQVIERLLELVAVP